MNRGLYHGLDPPRESGALAADSAIVALPLCKACLSVTLDLVAYELAMTGLITPDGEELVPGGESQITQDSEECTAIALAPDSKAISFEVLAP